MYRKLIGAAGALAVVAGLIVPGSWFAYSHDDGSSVAHAQTRHSSTLDTASSAIPSAANPSVTDVAQSTARSRAAGAKAISSSTATSDCDGCAGQATAFQVVYFDGAGAVADNTAAAWSSCTDCASSAVSVQLVVAQRAQSITVNNRAVALNANCTQCQTTSAAIEFVITGGSHRDLSAQAKDMIAQIQAQLADRLAPPARSDRPKLQGPTAKALVDDAASRLAAIILSDTGSTMTRRLIDVQVGK
jgi:hypothetical protein